MSESELKCFGETEFGYKTEGGLSEKLTAKIPEDVNRNRVNFIQGDACDLPSALGDFDFVLLANLIDRLPKPSACLKFLPHLVKRHGSMLITSPYTWTKEFTPKSEWLGGYMENSKPVKSIETLEKLLKKNFELCECVDLPFIIREHARKFQWSVSQASIWKRL